MGLLEILENILLKKKRERIIELKEIFCKRKDNNYIKKFRTSVVGAEHKNIDGSERQEALKKLKGGEKVRLIWSPGGSSNKEIVYLVKKSLGKELNLPDCFGRLNDKVAGDVMNWLNQKNIVTSATVVKITGGTRKRPKLGCVLELTTYQTQTQNRSKTDSN